MENSNGQGLDTIGLSATLEGASVNVGVRTRFTTAVDRLAGNLADIPNWFLEAARDRKKARDAASLAAISARFDVNASLIRAEGEVARTRMYEFDNIGDRLIDGLLRDEGRKQTNKRAVLIDAAETIRAESLESDIAEENVDIDDDWMNVFASYAERASSDEIRGLWGRILAGEIRKPRSFSLTTLRVISEMDKKIAETFERVLEYRVGGAIIVEDNNKVLFNDLMFLEEFGLLMGSDGTLNIQPKSHQDGFYYLSSDTLQLRILASPGSGGPLRLGGISLTAARLSRVAKEIVLILPARDELIPMRRAAAQIATSAESVEIVRWEGGQAVILEKIK